MKCGFSRTVLIVSAFVMIGHSVFLVPDAIYALMNNEPVGNFWFKRQGFLILPFTDLDYRWQAALYLAVGSMYGALGACCVVVLRRRRKTVLSGD